MGALEACLDVELCSACRLLRVRAPQRVFLFWKWAQNHLSNYSPNGISFGSRNQGNDTFLDCAPLRIRLLWSSCWKLKPISVIFWLSIRNNLIKWVRGPAVRPYVHTNVSALTFYINIFSKSTWPVRTNFFMSHQAMRPSQVPRLDPPLQRLSGNK